MDRNDDDDDDDNDEWKSVFLVNILQKGNRAFMFIYIKHPT